MQAHKPVLILCSHKGEEEYQVNVYDNGNSRSAPGMNPSAPNVSLTAILPSVNTVISSLRTQPGVHR